MIEKLTDEVKNELPAAAKAAQDAARDAERSRAAQPKYESQAPPPKARGRAKPRPRVRVQARMTHAALAGRPIRPTIRGDGTQVHRQAVAAKVGATAKDGEKHSFEYQGYPTIT